MNIETAKKLDYVISVINNELSSNFNFKLFWNTNLLGVITADLINFENSFPIEKKLINGYVRKENLYSKFMSLRKKFFEEYNLADGFALNDFINAIKDDSAMVLNDLINLVNNDESNISVDNVIFNVELINLSQKFESMIIPKDLTLTPISLLVTSKN